MPVIKSTATSGLLLKLKKNKSKSKSKEKALTKAEEQSELRKKSIEKLIQGKIKS